MEDFEPFLDSFKKFKEGIFSVSMDFKELSLKTTEDPKYKELLKDCYKYSKKSNHPSTHNAATLVDEGKLF